MAKRIKHKGEFLISITAILLLFLLACGSPPDQPMSPSSDNATKPPAVQTTNQTENGKFPPPMVLKPPELPKPGNPKLNGALNQLIEAEKSGQAESFARQVNIDMVDGKVRVAIYAAPGQLDVAANVTAKYGTVEIVSRRLNAVRAMVPVTGLTALASESSISLITVPVPTTPTNQKNGSVEHNQVLTFVSC